uniref:Uncharacterized protein n=1 Tax=Lotus japonicus TaxID=34305 RepID=I3S8I9_LOTJA|nr:unknown [Lotus japonicus]
MLLAMQYAVDCIVIMGLTPTALGKTLPSHTYNPFASQLSPFSSTAPSSSVALILQLVIWCALVNTVHTPFLELGPPTTLTLSRNSSQITLLDPSTLYSLAITPVSSHYHSTCCNQNPQGLSQPSLKTFSVYFVKFVRNSAFSFYFS